MVYPVDFNGKVPYLNYTRIESDHSSTHGTYKVYVCCYILTSSHKKPQSVQHVSLSRATTFEFESVRNELI